MDTTVVSTWHDLVEQTFAGSFSERLERYRSPFAFRGMVADWPVTSSLQRLRHDSQTLGFIEKAMFRNFKKYAFADFDARNSDWKWLSLAQHHGLPTRLLDWTFSPFVAMHFATNELDKMDKDGVIWMVNFDRVRAYLPDFFRNALSEHYALTFSVEMLEEDPRADRSLRLRAHRRGAGSVRDVLRAPLARSAHREPVGTVLVHEPARRATRRVAGGSRGCGSVVGAEDHHLGVGQVGDPRQAG